MSSLGNLTRVFQTLFRTPLRCFFLLVLLRVSMGSEGESPLDHADIFRSQDDFDGFLNPLNSHNPHNLLSILNSSYTSNFRSANPSHRSYLSEPSEPAYPPNVSNHDSRGTYDTYNIVNPRLPAPRTLNLASQRDVMPRARLLTPVSSHSPRPPPNAPNNPSDDSPCGYAPPSEDRTGPSAAVFSPCRPSHRRQRSEIQSPARIPFVPPVVNATRIVSELAHELELTSSSTLKAEEAAKVSFQSFSSDYLSN